MLHSSDRTGLGLNKSAVEDSLQHLNSMNPHLVNIHDRGKKLTPQSHFSNTHKKTQTHTDINGHVRHMYTHTKEKKKHPLDFSSYRCVYLATAQGYMSCLSAQPCLGTEMFHTLGRESYGRLHFFHRELPKVATGVRNQNTNVSACEAIHNNVLCQEWVYLSTSDNSHRKVRLSTGRLARTSTKRHG